MSLVRTLSLFTATLACTAGGLALVPTAGVAAAGDTRSVTKEANAASVRP